MAGPRDDTYESLPARLSELFGALETTLQSVAEKGGEPARHDVVLEMIGDLVSPALMQEAEAASLSYPAVWHMLHFTVAILERARMPVHGTGSGPYRHLNSVIKKLNDELGAAPSAREYEMAEGGQEPQAQQQPEATSDTGAASYWPWCAGELQQIKCLLSGLPAALANALLASIPAAVPAVRTALGPTATTPSTPVVTFQNLNALAAASVSTYTTSAAERIAFLQGALTVLKSSGPVPPTLIPQINSVVAGVLSYIDPGLSGPDLFAITALSQQIAPLLSSPAAAGGK